MESFYYVGLDVHKKTVSYASRRRPAGRLRRAAWRPTGRR